MSSHLDTPYEMGERRVIAVGIIRRTPRRTTRITATPAGVTGSIRPAAPHSVFQAATVAGRPAPPRRCRVIVLLLILAAAAAVAIWFAVGIIADHIRPRRRTTSKGHHRR